MNPTDVSDTAQVLLNTDPVSLIHLGLMTLLGLAFAMPNQAFIEHAIAEKPWLNNAWGGALKGLKPLLPGAISAIFGLICHRLGFTPQDAVAAAAALMTGTHGVNASPLAAVVNTAPPSDEPKTGQPAVAVDLPQKP